MENKLEILGLCKNYENAPVVKNVSFCVKTGEFLSILGSSGCGKTTILRMLAGVLQPTSGKILKDGNDITNFPPATRNIGIVFQNYALFEAMSVFENISYAPKIRKIPDYKQKTQNLMEKMGLSELKDKKPCNLSGGQQQRVAIARTMVLEPDVILFDEPLSALDVSTRLKMQKEIKSLQTQSGITIVYVTHDQEEAISLSDRIMVMDKGEIQQIDSPEEILSHPANDFVKNFVGENIKIKIDALSKYKISLHA